MRNSSINCRGLAAWKRGYKERIVNCKLQERVCPVMNKKKWRILILVLLLVLTAGCGKRNTESTEAATEVAVTKETTEPLIPGVEENSFSENDFLEVTTETTESVVVEETESAEPTEAKKPTESTKPAVSTKPVETANPTESANSIETTETMVPEENSQPTTGNDQNTEEEKPSAYENYMNMSGAEQQAFIESFDSLEAFFVWLNNAKDEDEAKKDVIIVDDGVIDLGSLIG